MSAHTRISKLRAKAALFVVLMGTVVPLTFSLGLRAQETPRVRDKDDAAPRGEDSVGRPELAGYSRPGSPSDTISDDGKIIPASFEGVDKKKFRILGATVYFAVFKNMHRSDENDTFGTGMQNFDRRFEPGRSFTDTYSPRFDKKAKYLYLYQIVNDRFMNSQVAAAAVKDEKKGELSSPLFDPTVKLAATTAPPKTDNIQQFEVKLLVDPRFITSWGQFSNSGFVADVVGTDASGKPIKQVVDDGGKKVEREREIRLAFCYLPEITTKLPFRAFVDGARPVSLGDLEKGFGVGPSAQGMNQSKAYQDLKTVAAADVKENIQFAAFVNGLVKSAEAGRNPDFVQINFSKYDAEIARGPGLPGLGVGDNADDTDYSVFRVNWAPGKTLKQGDRSVLVGFTSDLPPVYAPVRTDSDQIADPGIRLTAFGAGTGSGSAPGTAIGTVATPAPAAPAAAGGGGIPGGFGAPPIMGGGGGGGTPAFNPALPGGLGAGGGFGGGGTTGGGTTGTGTTNSNNGTNTPAQMGQQTINFTATLTNQQKQQQQQQQKQQQQQSQSQSQSNQCHHEAVPAPDSLILALLGLPCLVFFLRRKSAPFAVGSAA